MSLFVFLLVGVEAALRRLGDIHWCLAATACTAETSSSGEQRFVTKPAPPASMNFDEVPGISRVLKAIPAFGPRRLSFGLLPSRRHRKLQVHYHYIWSQSLHAFESLG